MKFTAVDFINFSPRFKSFGLDSNKFNVPNSSFFIHQINKFPINQRALKFKIGFVPQFGGYFHNLTVYENLKAIAEITIKNLSYRVEKINSLISKFELDQIRDIKADFLSGGQ